MHLNCTQDLVSQLEKLCKSYKQWVELQELTNKYKTEVQEGLDLYNYLIGINVSAVARFSKDEAKIGTIEGKFYFYGIDIRCTVRYPNGGFDTYSLSELTEL